MAGWVDFLAPPFIEDQFIDSPEFAARWRSVADDWSFGELNELIAVHNEWYPVERDLPMDLADASIIVSAEVTGERRVFTLDGDFRVYQLKDGSNLEVIP